MPPAALPPPADNEYTFGSDTPSSSSRSKKKKKSKASTAIDIEPKRDPVPPVDTGPSEAPATTDDNPVVPDKEDSKSEPPEHESSAPTADHVPTTLTDDSAKPAIPSSQDDDLEAQRHSPVLDMLDNTDAPTIHFEPLKPPASPEETPQEPEADKLSLTKPQSATPFIRQDLPRRPLDPAPDRRHPSLQTPSPKASPIVAPVRMSDPPATHLPPQSRVADWQFGPVDRSASFLPAVQFDTCTTPAPRTANNKSTFIVNNLVLLGNQGGLDVCRLNRQREIVGRLEGLRGAVIEAKILPPPLSRNDPLRHLRPLVACVVHGPLADDTIPASISSIRAYQTSVELYSLKTSSHVQTLFTSPLINLDRSPSHQVLQPPSPDFHIALATTGRFMTIAIGTSGEVLVFDLIPKGSLEGQDTPPFPCVGKFWTVCKSRIVPVQEAIQQGHEQQPQLRRLPDVPLFSLSGRWLAIVPPLLSSSQKSADGKLHPDAAHDASVSSFNSPPPPQVDCEVDSPADGGILNRVTKHATQEVVKGAQWVGEQGLGMLKSYWRRASQSSSEEQARSAQATHMRGPSSSPEDSFPPTHGHTARREPVVKPMLVSIIDLNRFASSGRDKATESAVLATFSLSDGCSFLSFDPSGLSLLTSNQPGDVSTVWNLSRIVDAGPMAGTKLVLCQARWPRLSPCSVVDVCWNNQGRRVGILTQKGTVHLHEVPSRDGSDSFRRRSSILLETNLNLTQNSASPQSPKGAPSGWVSNVVSGWQSVQHRLHDSESEGLVDSTRKKLGEAGVMARNAGGRAVRSGYTSAIGGAQSLRNAQRNKIRLKVASVPARPGCSRWLSGKAEGLIAVADDGSLSTYAIKTNFYSNGKKVAASLDAGKKVTSDQVLNTVSASAAVSLPPSVLGKIDPHGPFAACANAGVHGFWTLATENAVVGPGAPQTTRSTQASFHPKASNVTFDKETCPQFMPFHRYRHVQLCTFDGPDDSVKQRLGVVAGEGKDKSGSASGSASGSGSTSRSPWNFGQALPLTTKITVVQSRSSPDTDADGLDEAAGGLAIADDGFALKT